MKNLFEVPELLTLDGKSFTDELAVVAADDPKSCVIGCDGGCRSGGCFNGSKPPIPE